MTCCSSSSVFASTEASGSLRSGTLRGSSESPAERSARNSRSWSDRVVWSVAPDEAAVPSYGLSTPRYVEPLPEPPMLITRDLDRAAGVPTWLAEQGHAPGTRVLRATERRANPVEQETLDPEDGKVFAIQRVRSADGIPVSLEEMTLPAQRFPGLLEDSLASVYELMDREYGVRVARCEETILSAVASPASAVLLCVEPGSALHDIRRRAYDSRGACFEISRDLFRADLTRLTTTSR